MLMRCGIRWYVHIYIYKYLVDSNYRARIARLNLKGVNKPEWDLFRLCSGQCVYARERSLSLVEFYTYALGALQRRRDARIFRQESRYVLLLLRCSFLVFNAVKWAVYVATYCGRNWIPKGRKWLDCCVLLLAQMIINRLERLFISHVHIAGRGSIYILYILIVLAGIINDMVTPGPARRARLAYNAGFISEVRLINLRV